MAGIRQQQRRAERKAAREKRAKDNAKKQMSNEIRRLLIDKGSVVSPVVNQDLLDIHGCYQRGNQFLGALGGQLQQMYYVVNAIFQKYDERRLESYYKKLAEDPKQDSLKNASSPRELVLENYFLPFFLTSMKELKSDSLSFLITPQLDALLSSFKLPTNSH